MFWPVLIGSFLLGTCGDVGDAEKEVDSGAHRENPWKEVGNAQLPEDKDAVTDYVRILVFDDGMTVVYDGSDSRGREEVCRQRDREGVLYQVCMSLESDPYFEMMAWRPLMFDSFNTVLICKINDDVRDCEDVFLHMGGAGFGCEASVFKGDMALICHDRWAVVVNGSEDDTKTVCRVHVDAGTGRCLGSPKSGITDEELILEMQQSTWTGVRSIYANKHQVLPGETLAAVAPRNIPPGARLNYASSDESICSVDNDGSDGGLGTVTIDSSAAASQSCDITLIIVAEGFVDRVFTIPLKIVKDNDTAWEDYTPSHGVFFIGENLNAGAVTSSDPVSPQLDYTSLDESVCTVDRSGVVTAVATGVCTIRLLSQAEDYRDVVIDKTVHVLPLSQLSAIEWSSFPTTASVGAFTAELANPIIKGVAGYTVLDSGAVFLYENTAGDCFFDSTTKILSFSEETECVITVTASMVRGYHDLSQAFRVTPGKGDLGLIWTGYGEMNPKLTDSPPVLIAPTTSSPLDGNGVSYSYAVSTGNICGVDRSTGVLTLKKTGACMVIATASRIGYDNDTATVTVNIAKGEQGVTATEPYGGAQFLGAGDSLSLENDPDGGQVALVYRKKNASDDCTVTSQGEITAGSSGTGTCTVQAMWVAGLHHDASDWADIVTVNMVANGQDFSWGPGPYGPSVALKVGETLALVNAPTGGTGGAEYKTSHDSICIVAADGTVTGVGVGTCLVQGRWRGDATMGASDWMSVSLTISRGDGPTDLRGEHIYGIRPSLAVGKTLEVVEAPIAYGEVVYRVKSGFETHCQVDRLRGVVTGLTVGTCTIEGTLTGSFNYTASQADLLTVSIQPGVQTINIGSNPYGTTNDLTVGGRLNIAHAPVGSHGGSISYRVKTGLSAYCSVLDGGSLVGISPGVCTVQAQAAAVTPNYGASPWTDIVTLEVGKGTLQGITWTPTQERGVVGEDLLLDAAGGFGITGIAVTYVVVDEGRSDCAFKGTTGTDARTLVFQDVGTCLVGLRATHSHGHYHDWEGPPHAIGVGPGSIDFTAGTFSSSARLKVGVATPRTPSASSGLTPADVEVSWRLVRGERDCRVTNPQTGAVVARAVPIDGGTRCTLIAVGEKRGYRAETRGPVEIPLEKGDLGTISSPNYGFYNELPVGGSVNLMVPPEEAGHAELVTSYSVQGTNSIGSHKSHVCRVDADGTIHALSGGVAGDKCIVSTTVTAVGYNDPAPGVVSNVTLTLKEGLFFNTHPELAWGGTLTVGVGAPLTQITNLPTGDDSNPSVSVTWDYRASEWDRDGHTAKTSGHVCSVNSSGQLRVGTNPSPGDICRVQVIASATGNHVHYTKVPTVDLIVYGVLGTISPQVYGIGGLPVTTLIRGVLDGDVNVITPPNESNHIPIVVSYTAVGKRGGVETPNICWVDNNSISATFGTVGLDTDAERGDTCEITATASATYYHDKDATTVVLSVVDQLVFPSDLALDYSGDLEYGSTTAITQTTALPPEDNNSVAVTWVYGVVAALSGSTGDFKTDVCVVDATSGDLTLGSAALPGDACLIAAIATADGYANGAIFVPIEVEVGELLFATATIPSYSGMLRVSGTISPTLPGSQVDDNGITVVWENWRAEENDRDGSDDGLHDGDVCSIDNMGVVSADGSDASAGDTCTIYAAATADHYGDQERVVGTLTLSAQGVFTNLTAPTYTDDLAPGGAAISMATPPTATPSLGTTWTFAAVGTRSGVNTDDICSVGTDGTVAPESAAMVGDVCTITASAHHNGYAPAAVPSVALTLQGSFDSLTWAAFPMTGTVGSTITLGSRPVSSPVADSYTIGINSGDCTYDEDAHALIFTNTTPCVVSVTASKEHYADIEGTFTVTPGAGTLAFATTPTIGYSGDLRYEDLTTQLSPVALPTEDDNGVSISWNYAAEGRGSDGTTPKANVCELATDNKVVLLSGAAVGDICDIGVTGSATGYDDYTALTNLQMSVLEGIIAGVAWSPPSTGTVGTPLTLPEVTGSEAADTVTYSKVSGSCTLDADARIVNFSGAGNCVVKATVARANYETWDSGDKTISTSAGTIAFATAPTLTYSGTLKYGDTITLLTPSGLANTDDNTVSVTWHYTIQGRNSADDADKANVCVRGNTDSSNADYNKIKLGSAAAFGDICRVSVVARAAGYADYSGVTGVDLTVGLGTQSSPTGWSNHYGASPSVGVGGMLSSTGTEPTNPKSDGGALEYHIKSGSCTIDAASGEVTGGGMGSCVVEARYAAVTDKYTASDYSDVATITIAMGTQSYTWNQTDTTRAFADGLEVTITNGTNPVLVPGTTPTYHIDPDTNTAGCAWKGASGADARTLTVTDDGSCRVHLRVARTGYGTWQSPWVTVTITPLDWDSVAWTGYFSSSINYGNTAPTANTPTSVPDADSWTYSTTSANCSVDSDDGSLTITAVGVCTVTINPIKAGYAAHTGVEGAVTVSKGTQSAPGAWGSTPAPYGSATPTVRVGQTLAIGSSTPPTNSLTGGGALEFHVKSGGTHCSVTNDGTVEGVTVGDCTIEARFASTTNYNPSPYADVATISVTPGETSYTWGQTDTTVTFGTGGNELALEALSPLPPAAATTTYRVTGTNTAVCALKGSSGVDARTLTIADAGTCDVEVSVTRPNYEDWNSGTVTITVDPATWIAEPRWGGFNAGTIDFGTTASFMPQSSTPTASWAYVTHPDDSAVCDRSDRGRLTILSAGICRVTYTATLAGYPTRSITETLTIQKAAQDAPGTWSEPYGASPTVTIGGDPLPIDTDSTAPTGHGALKYQVKSGFTTYCRVDASTGAVTGLTAGLGQMCGIQARFAGNGNYNPSPYTDIADVGVYGRQTLTAPTYAEGTHLYMGTGNQVWLDPTVAFIPRIHGTSTPVPGYTFSYMVLGRRGTATTAGICTMVGDMGGKRGIVQVGNAAQTGDTCEVMVTSNAPNYSPVSASVTLTVRSAITYTELASRILTDNCLACHGSGDSRGDLSSNADMIAEGVLNIDPAQADIWKRVKKTNAWSDSAYSSINHMPPASENCRNGDVSGCLTAVEVEYLASFLRGGSWQP